MKRILAIETSCDDTAVALVKGEVSDGCVRCLKNCLATQEEIHEAYGGVVPELASRCHLEKLPGLVEEALEGVPLDTLSAIAVTAGPGLIGSLLVGLSFAKGFSYANHLPLVPINHLYGHLASLDLDREQCLPFPRLILLVSGGHTELVWQDSIGKAVSLQRTVDDAAGECYDKLSKILGYGYPGGKWIHEEGLKAKGDSDVPVFPRPLLKDSRFSFSGLKSAARRFWEEHSQVRKEAVARGVDEAILEVLLTKARMEALKRRPALLGLAGGVSAHPELRQRLQEIAEELGVLFAAPLTQYCTDNAAMIASAALADFSPLSLEEVLSLDAKARMRIP